jgi:uncharacterized membrane protein YdjX (TVP38/TMEM64 family)
MRDMVRPLMVVAVICLISIVPFIWFGADVEAWFRNFAANPPSAAVTAWVVLGLLSVDILLPVPSSMISTLAGWHLGWWQGTIISTLGMSIGAILGFALARRFGERIALWFAKPEDLEHMAKVTDRIGPITVMVTRGVPVLAEASVFLVGINQLSWRRFLPGVLVSNFAVSLAYAVFGDVAQEKQWLGAAIGLSIAVPVLLTMLVRWLLPAKEAQ